MTQSWFELEFDTTAPHITWGNVAGASQGSVLAVDFASDEAVDRAFLVSGARRLEMVVLAGQLTIDVPTDWPGGLSAIEVHDDLGNARTYTAVVEFPGVVEPPPPQPVPEPFLGGGGWTPGVQLRTVKAELAGELVLAALELVAERVVAELDGGVRLERAVYASLDGAVSAERLVLVTIEGAREPALLLMQARAEDEELLALLGVMS